MQSPGGRFDGRHFFTSLDNINTSKYQFMLKKNISPQHDDDIKKLLLEIARLNDNMKSANLFSFEQLNDKPTCLVRVVESLNLFRFKKNVSKHGMITKFIQALMPKEQTNLQNNKTNVDVDAGDVDKEDENYSAPVTEAIDSSWIMEVLERKYEDKFTLVAVKLELPVKKKP